MSIKLCLDAGHGMSNKRPGVYDSGATAGGVTEADITLQWVLTGKWYCNQQGIAVYLTRDDDRDPDPVGQRDDKAEAAGCTHLLCIHCNSFAPNQRGTETYYRDSRDKALAALCQSAAMVAIGGKDRGLKSEEQSQHDRLAIFDFDGPAALCEIGNIDNPTDRAKMLQRDTRIAFWTALIAALKPA